MRPRLEVLGVTGIGEVRHGDDLAALIVGATELADGDVVVVSSKVVSKAEGRVVEPLAGEGRDAARRRLSFEDEVLAETPAVVIVRTQQGFVCANAGIDASNVAGEGLLLLPADADASAARIRDGIRLHAGVEVGVIVSDTFGRAWRSGLTDVALGVAGVEVLRDERGGVDREGRPLSATLVAVADELAGAADLVRDKAAGIPVVVIRGLEASPGGTAQDLVRPPREDLFAHGRGWLARRLATGAGVPVRDGEPSAEEWALVMAAAGGGEGVWRDGRVLHVAEGLAAGRAEAALLDLGYGVALSGTGPWQVRVLPGE